MENFSYSNEFAINNNSLLYTINRAGCSELGLDFHIKRNSLYPYCVIHYVVEGSGYVVWKGRKYNFNKGQFFILNPYEGHEYGITEGGCLSFSWIEFYGGDSERLMNHIIRQLSPVIDLPCCESINCNIQQIFELLQAEKVSLTGISRLIYNIITAFVECYENDTMVTKSVYGNLKFEKALEYIDSNLNNDLNVKKLAEICNYSPTYFSKLFIKTYGISISQYIIRQRINRAKELLTTSDIQIEALAEKLGFCSPSHCIRSFRSCEGVTPSEYRRQNLLLRGHRR